MPFQQRTAIITGASGNLGSKVAYLLARQGTKLVIPYISDEWRPEGLLEWMANKDIDHLAFPADVTNHDQVRSMMFEAQNRFGTLDILVNCVGGVGKWNTVEETEPEEWDRLMDINLKSAFVCCRAVLPWMKEQRRGRIVNIAGRQGLRAMPNTAAYAAAKAGLIRLTEVIAAENKKTDITANVVVPSIIDTPENRKAMPKEDPNKWVKPEELAKVILFLISDEAQAINGSVIEVPGKI